MKKDYNQRKAHNARLERNRNILALRKSGFTLQQIGDMFGMNKERVRQNCIKAERTLKHLKAVKL